MFKLNNTVRESGSLQDYVNGVTIERLTEVFGKPAADAYYEPERGYEGEEYRFVHDSGAVVTLYSRWGQFRIGAWSQDIVEPFLFWLAVQLDKRS